MCDHFHVTLTPTHPHANTHAHAHAFAHFRSLHPLKAERQRLLADDDSNSQWAKQHVVTVHNDDLSGTPWTDSEYET